MYVYSSINFRTREIIVTAASFEGFCVFITTWLCFYYLICRILLFDHVTHLFCWTDLVTLDDQAVICLQECSRLLAETSDWSSFWTDECHWSIGNCYLPDLFTFQNRFPTCLLSLGEAERWQLTVHSCCLGCCVGDISCCYARSTSDLPWLTTPVVSSPTLVTWGWRYPLL